MVSHQMTWYILAHMPYFCRLSHILEYTMCSKFLQKMDVSEAGLYLHVLVRSLFLKKIGITLADFHSAGSTP